VGGHTDHVKRKRRARRQRLQFDVNEVRDNRSLFNLLNDKDRDILYLVFVSRKKQQSIRRILQRSQPMLVYDIRRIRERMQFIVYLRQVFDIFLDFLEYHSEAYTSEMIEMLIMMYYTSSYTQASLILGKPQIYVRYTFDKILKMMQQNKHWEAYEIFSAIRRNKNKVKRVYKNRRKCS